MNKLVLLHGALGAADQLQPLSDRLRDFEILTFDWLGHGGAPLTHPSFSIDAFADQLVQFLNTHDLIAANLFGYSMGGYIALHLAAERPDRVGRIFTLGTRYLWSQEVADKERKLLDPGVIEAKVPKFAEILAKRHQALDWRTLCTMTADLLDTLGNTNPLQAKLGRIRHRVCAAVGDGDLMADPDITRQAANMLPRGEFVLLPETPHPTEKANLDDLAAKIRHFFTQTAAPVG